MSAVAVIVYRPSTNGSEVEHEQLFKGFVGKVGFEHDLDASCAVLQDYDSGRSVRPTGPPMEDPAGETLEASVGVGGEFFGELLVERLERYGY